jgi:type VI secretion system secreted protein VgrG
VIGITSPAGIGFATSKAIVSYAASNIDTVAQQHLQLTAGQRFNLNAGKGISLFSHHDGITAIAHHGKLLMESQHDDTEIHSAKNIKLSAAEGKLIGSAKVIELIADDGSFIRIGDGGITLGSDGTIKFNAADFIYDAPAKLARTFKTFDSAATDLKFVARYYADTDDPLPAPEMNFKIHSEDGSETAGSSDGEGKSALLESDAMHIASIDIEDKDSEL